MFMGMYLTYGLFPYRVVDMAVTESGEIADLEDCYWLSVVGVLMGDLLAGR
jgi:hypothetical protein